MLSAGQHLKVTRYSSSPDTMSTVLEDVARARQAISTSALLKEFPWNSNVVFHQGSWVESFQQSPWVKVKPFFSGFLHHCFHYCYSQKFIDRMHEFESAELSRGSHPAFRKGLRLGEDVCYHIAKESESSGDNKPLFQTTKQTVVATTFLLNYRVLDVACWLQMMDSNSSLCLSFQQRRGQLPIQQLSNVVCTQCSSSI